MLNCVHFASLFDFKITYLILYLVCSYQFYKLCFSSGRAGGYPSPIVGLLCLCCLSCVPVQGPYCLVKLVQCFNFAIYEVELFYFCVAFLHMLENGANAMDWLKDPDVGPILLQISRIYTAEYNDCMLTPFSNSP